MMMSIFRKAHAFLLLIVGVLLTASCRSTMNEGTHPVVMTTAMEYAELLQMEDVGEGRTLCRILDPWRSGRTMVQYLLVPKSDTISNSTLSAQYGESVVLRTPLQHMTLTTACHTWLMSQLEALDKVAVLCDTMFVNAPAVRSWMRSKKDDGRPQVLDAGTATAPNIEVLLTGRSDAIWISPYENANLGNLDKLQIPIIYCAEYMENSPLARAEWMRFYGRLVGKSHEADSLFARVSTRYESLAKRSHKGQSLLVDLPYGASWYVPGGRSNSALLYADAGYDYPWSDDTHSGSLSLSKEAVLAKAQTCELWLIRYMDSSHDWTLEELKAQNPLFSKFKAAQEGNVWGCNTARSDFFDVVSFRPDSLLESLIRMDGAFYRRM